MNRYVSLAEILNRSYVKQNNNMYALTPDELERVISEGKILVNKEFYRENYMGYISEILDIDKEEIEQHFPNSLEIREQDYLKEIEWKGWESPKGMLLKLCFDSFVEIYTELLTEEGYLFDDTDILTHLSHINTVISKYSDTRNLSDDNITELLIMILFYSNLEDVFGNGFIKMYYEDLVNYFPEYKKYNLKQNSSFLIEPKIYSIIKRDLNDVDLYLLNLREYSATTKKDLILSEIKRDIRRIIDELNVDVSIMENDSYKKDIIYGYIRKMLTVRSDLEKTTTSVNVLPIKPIFKVFKNNIRISGTEEEREYDEKIIDSVINEIISESRNREKSKFKNDIEMIIEEIICFWWSIYRNKEGLSIQEALKKINLFDKDLREYGMYIEHQFISPYTIRLIVYNDIKNYDLTREQMKDNLNYASYILLDTAKTLKVTQRLTGLQQVNENDSVINLYGANNFLFRAFDLPVYSWGN